MANTRSKRSGARTEAASPPKKQKTEKSSKAASKAKDEPKEEPAADQHNQHESHDGKDQVKDEPRGEDEKTVQASTKDIADNKDEPDTKPSPESASAILAYLLQDETLDSISPKEILTEEAKRGMRYPHSTLPPFCALISALLLSKPFSHRLGMRAIYTIFNEPYHFTTPKAILDAGGDDRWQALMDAHTLHKEKTSGQMRDLSQYIVDTFPNDAENGELKSLRDAASGDVDKLKKTVMAFNGFAEKTTSLFFRRAQVQWEELFPFADELALDAARDVGLEVQSPEDLLKLVKEQVKLDGQALREKFVQVLEVLIGKKLDKDIDEVKEEVGQSSTDEKS